MRIAVTRRSLFRWEDARRRVRVAVERGRHPPPRCRVVTGPASPVWVLRVGLVTLAVFAWLLVLPGLGDPGVPGALAGPSRVLLIVLLVGVTLRPGGTLPAAYALGVGVVVAVLPPPGPGTVAALVALLPALAALGQVLSTMPLAGLVELPVLVPTLRRWLVGQAVVQPVALLAAVLAGRGLDLPLVTLGAGVAVVAVGIWLLPRLSAGR